MPEDAPGGGAVIVAVPTTTKFQSSIQLGDGYTHDFRTMTLDTLGADSRCAQPPVWAGIPRHGATPVGAALGAWKGPGIEVRWGL